ncbi:MAG TPA: imidazole glycerol phosphate synthase subunit HisH [Patescibacteria group bacterium]|nr:imidazole glycerol phosphate synthase subunit HisH [Patescibacteria group bacterium]
MIAIIDYGMGNIHSVQKALERMSAATTVTNRPADIAAADKIVLPGVGAFDDAMAELEKRGLIEAIKEQVAAGKSFLGICLGMQLLFQESQEARTSKGLGLLKGAVKRFAQDADLKVPHMGWNQLSVKKAACPLLRDIAEGAFVYFCHSYYPEPQDQQDVATRTDYGIAFASVVWKNNVYGVQFHPEKSQDTGLTMLKNFVNLC